MNAAETIAAAIEKLERLRDEATGNGLSWEVGPGDKFEYEVFASDSDSAHAFAAASDAELIVTLHRTIDAQLAILRIPTGHPRMHDAQVALARAILGEVS